jgi:hypothetical protein
MTREDALQLMSCRLYDLLGQLFAYYRNWRPKIGYPANSAGFSSGGSVSEFADLEDEVDTAALKVLEAGWDELGESERVYIEMLMGVTPWVWTVRPSVMESAIEKLEKRLRMIGA